jgi:hypothetical protein
LAISAPLSEEPAAVGAFDDRKIKALLGGGEDMPLVLMPVGHVAGP